LAFFAIIWFIILQIIGTPIHFVKLFPKIHPNDLVGNFHPKTIFALTAKKKSDNLQPMIFNNKAKSIKRVRRTFWSYQEGRLGVVCVKQP